MNNPVPSPSSEDSRLDEWGKYVMKREDVMKIDKDGVLEAIRDHNPAVTAVNVNVDEDDGGVNDWGAAGRYLGNSKHVKHLEMNFWNIMDSLDLQSCCDGLAVNKSIESLDISFYWIDLEHDVEDDKDDDNEQMRLRSFRNELIGKLLPFFENNGNLIAVNFSFDSDAPASRVSDVISASPSLKSIKFRCRGSEQSLIELAGIICKKEGARHITINGGFLDEGACLQIEKFLSGEHCQLKSLVLLVSYSAGIDSIISGITNNKSIECLQLSSGDYTISFLMSLRHTKLKSIKKLRLKPTELPSVLTLCHQIPKIETLTLFGNFQFNNSMWRISSCNMGPTSFSTLEDLRINDITSNEALLEELSSCLSNCGLLKSLSLKYLQSSREKWITIFNSIPMARLESISISDIITSDSVMTSFCNWVSSIQTLRVLHINNCRPMLTDGMQSLVTTLESLPNIEEVYFLPLNSRYQYYVPNDMNMLLSALVAKSSLKKLSVPVDNNNQLQTITNSLRDPAFSLTELSIRYCLGGSLGRLSEREHEQLSQIMVNALHRNTTLKSLVFETRYGENLFWWSMFSDLLCNKSSVDATYLSNHTLQSLPSFTRDNNVVPIEIYSILHSNKVSDKQRVAREKILQHHKLEDVNFRHSSLPVAMSWIGKSVSNLGLSQQYRLIRSAPHLIQNDQKKRKRQEFD